MRATRASMRAMLPARSTTIRAFDDLCAAICACCGSSGRRIGIISAAETCFSGITSVVSVSGPRGPELVALPSWLAMMSGTILTMLPDRTAA